MFLNNVRVVIAAALLASGLQAQAATTVPLSTEESADLTFMREEEKVARDVYLKLYDKWKLTVFSNISGSEQKHMDTILGLLIKYQLPDPAAGKLIGQFSDPALQALYTDLVKQGSLSKLSGLRVGALIEEVDIEDIVGAIERSNHADIDKAYNSLMCGSRNHLRAFVGNIETLTGQPYEAQVLDQEAVDAIVDSPMETCG